MQPETTAEELKRYVGFGDEDARLLAELRPCAEPQFPRIAREFYDRTREHEAAHAVFSDELQIERLQRSLVGWLERLLSGTYDAAYFAHTANIGQAHVRVGLPQRYMIGGMTLVRMALDAIAESALGAGAGPTRAAVQRILDVELACMLEAYREDSMSRVRRLEQVDRDDTTRALRRAEHRYVHAVELARVLVVGLDEAGRVSLFNREAERVTGYARDEVIGRPVAEVLLPEEGAEAHAALLAAAARGEPLSKDTLDSACRTRSGKVRDVRWHLAYARSEVEDDVVLFLVGIDTTDEHRLAARTRQHEKLAVVGTLAAGLAHEIRNPLNGAQLHVAFLDRALRRTGAGPDMTDAVAVVGDELKRLGALVSDFLDLARPRPLERRPTNLESLCDRAIQLVSADAQSAGARVSLDVPTREVVAAVDSAKVVQVLLNLLTNAVEAVAPNSGGKVVVRVRRQPRHAVIEVEDNGPGIPEATPIFDPFFSTKANGTGLGLAISQRIAMDHDGEIAVESKPGRTVFRLRLPIQE